MQYPLGKWVETDIGWLLFQEETVLNNGKAMKWFRKAMFNPDEAISCFSPWYGHLCPLRGEECVCIEIKENKFSFDAHVSTRVMVGNKLVRKDKVYHAYLIKGDNYEELSLSNKAKNSLVNALECAERNLMRCECGAAKVKTTHSAWCPVESYRREDV